MSAALPPALRIVVVLKIDDYPHTLVFKREVDDTLGWATLRVTAGFT
ncbi:MAG: hypothetical protein ACXW4P_13845 [Thermoanaerobaculia bacterium]